MFFISFKYFACFDFDFSFQLPLSFFACRCSIVFVIGFGQVFVDRKQHAVELLIWQKQFKLSHVLSAYCQKLSKRYPSFQLESSIMKYCFFKNCY